MTSADLIANFKKQPIGFACALICVVCGVVIYLQSGKITQKEAEFESKSAEAERILANVRNSSGLAEQVGEAERLAAELEGRLMQAGQLAVNLQYFYKLEAENEVKLTDIRQGTVPKSSRGLFIGVPYTVTIQGPFKNVATFLQRLEAGRHFCRITTATFNKAAGAVEGPAQGNTAMSLSLTLELLGKP